jgi:hypothetical protein
MQLNALRTRADNRWHVNDLMARRFDHDGMSNCRIHSWRVDFLVALWMFATRTGGLHRLGNSKQDHCRHSGEKRKTSQHGNSFFSGQHRGMAILPNASWSMMPESLTLR